MAANGLQLATRTYVAAQVCVAFGLTLATVASAARPTAREALAGAALAGCMALAWLFPLHFAFKTKLYMDTAVTIAAILLFEPALAMLAAAGGTFLAHGLHRGSRDWIQAIFNAAQAVLLTAIGSAFLAAAGWDPAEPSFGRPWSLAILPVAAVMMHGFSVLTVATVVALQAQAPLVESWKQAFVEDPRVETLAQISLVGIGLVAAIVIDDHPWGLAFLVAPVVAVYWTLRQQGRLRQEAERARLASEASLAQAQRIAHVGSWSWDLSTDRLAWSDEALRIMGLPLHADRPTYEAFLRAVAGSDRDRVDRAIREAIEARARLTVDYQVRLPDGTSRLLHQEADVYANGADRTVRLDGTIQDVTERKLLEARIADATERQRIARELAEAQRGLAASREDERLRLARGLHDGPVQDLLAISYHLAALQTAHDRDWSGTEAGPAIDLARRQLLEVVGHLRGMVGELRPAGLAEFGLSTAIEGYIARLQRHANGHLPAIILDIDGELNDLPHSLALALFRIVQEALRNALRHAGANEVTVGLAKREGAVELRVHDDGRGFAVPPQLNALAEAGHFGIVGVMERVEQADGNLTIESGPSAGTTICIRLPLAASRGDDA